MRRRGLLLLGLLLAASAGAEPLQFATDGYRPIAYLENGHPSGAICDVLADRINSSPRRPMFSSSLNFTPLGSREQG